MQQQVLAVSGGVDPLAQRLVETLVTVGNVLGGTSRTRRSNPASERAEDLMTKIVLRRHRACLLQRDAVESCITYDADLAMLEAEGGDLFGRGLSRDHRNGRQRQKDCGHSANYTTRHGSPEAPNAHQARCDAQPFSTGNMDASRRGRRGCWTSSLLSGVEPIEAAILDG